MNDIDNLILLPAILFPAIPLMMVNFGNRYNSLSSLIRKIHDEFINKKISPKDKSAKRYLAQIQILRQRLILNRFMQTLSSLSFILNLLSIYFAFKYPIFFINTLYSRYDASNSAGCVNEVLLSFISGPFFIKSIILKIAFR